MKSFYSYELGVISSDSQRAILQVRNPSDDAKVFDVVGIDLCVAVKTYNFSVGRYISTVPATRSSFKL